MRKNKRLFYLASMLLLQALSNTATAAHQTEKNAVEILFLGNSIIYTGNLPYTFSELARTSGITANVEMYAQPGARVSDLLDDQHVRAILKQKPYDFIVFHDRGGDAICLLAEPDEPYCTEMLNAHHALADLIRQNGAKPYLLGTYQKNPSPSARIVVSESIIATQIGAEHIPISEYWHKAMKQIPDGAWLSSDEVHPGKLLTTLMALEIYSVVFEQCPRIANINGDINIAIPEGSREALYRVNDELVANQPAASQAEVNTILSLTQPKCALNEVQK